MLPAVAARFQPALSVMRSLETQTARPRAEDDRKARGLPAQMPEQASGPALKSEPEDMKAINDYYFGNQLTVTEVLSRVVLRLVDKLNQGLEVGRNGKEEDILRGMAWRKEVSIEDIAINGDKDFVIPRPGENGLSFSDVALFIKTKFRTANLSMNPEFMRDIGESVGVKLSGLNLGDALDSFIDPTSDGARKARAFVSEALAGSAGSKASQHLEKALKGPQTVREAVEAVKNRPGTAEVDETTEAEDKQSVEDAKTHEKLKGVLDKQDRVAELNEEGAEAAPETADGLALIGIDKLAVETARKARNTDKAGPGAEKAAPLTQAETEKRIAALMEKPERRYREADAS